MVEEEYEFDCEVALDDCLIHTIILSINNIIGNISSRTFYSIHSSVAVAV